MTSRRGLAALLLSLALPASAQVKVRLSLAVPAAPAPVVAASSVLTAAPTLGALPVSALASPLAAPALAAPAASVAAAPVAASAAPVPTAARAAALSAALADFGRLDLRAAPAAEASAAGSALMNRALGGEGEAPASVLAAPADGPAAPALAPSAPAARPAGPRLYLLSKPLRETVTLGPLSVLAHVGYAAAWELAKAWAGYAAGGWAGALAVVAVELPASPLMVTARSLADLGQRYWRRKLAVLRELARVPGVERVRVLTSGEVQFAGPLARRKENTGLLFVETSASPPETIGRFGAPIPIDDPSVYRVRLTLFRGGDVAPEVWTPTLAELLDRRPLPSEIAAAWREALHPRNVADPVGRLADAAHAKDLRVEATLIGADGSERPLGALVDGPSVKGLIGLDRLTRLRVLLGGTRPARAIPVSDSAVERPGAARESGLGAALRRAWRRLSGRLIVAR